MSSKPEADDTSLWDENRNIIRSHKGGWVMGEAVYNHGYNMMDELVGHKSYMQIVILNATGRLVSKQLADWVEAVHICLSWPDPRIWCNHIGALGGTARCSIVAATVAGVIAADSRAYGSKPLIEGVGFIQRAHKELIQGTSVEDIVSTECARHGGKPYIMGYARPIAKGDERIPAMERVTKNLGFEVGPHLTLAGEIEEVLMRDFDEGMNINGYVSAFLSDQGLSAVEIYHMFITTVTSGVTACYVDAASKPAESFLALRCDDIDYQGKPHRSLPD